MTPSAERWPLEFGEWRNLTFSLPSGQDCSRGEIRYSKQNLSSCARQLQLARLLAQQNHYEGHAMLDKIYDWFTEGFDTADLKDAKALLEQL